MAYNNRDEILSLGVIDPTFNAFLQRLDEPPTHPNFPERRVMALQRVKQLTERLGRSDPATRKTRLTYRAADGTELAAFLYQPQSTTLQAPLIVMFHGGGFCLGSPESEEQGCRAYVNALGAVCLSVQYRLAPKHRFPTAPSDAWEALKFAASNATNWGAHPECGFIVGGNSAGGNLAAGLALKARDEELRPALTGQFLSCPWMCAGNRVPGKYQHLSFSYEQNKAAPLLPAETLNAYCNAY